MLSVECCKENFNILAISLNALYNYFNNYFKQHYFLSNLFKFLDISAQNYSFRTFTSRAWQPYDAKMVAGKILKFREEEAAPLGILKTRENQGRDRKKKGLPRGGNPLLIFF